MHHKTYGKKNNHISVQHINLYELSEVTVSIIKYTSILILNSLQEVINDGNLNRTIKRNTNDKTLIIILQLIKTTYAKCCVYDVKKIYEKHITRLIFVDMPVL